MSGFLFAFLACLLAGLGARDQALLAGITRVQGARPLLLATALIAALVTSAFAAWAGARLLPTLAPEARSLFAAMALAFSGAEMIALSPLKTPTEPTRSLFAAFLVLVAQQITDAARFLILALAVGTAAPIPTGMGGLAGSAIALTAGWNAPDLATTPLIPRIRRIAGVILLLTGLVLGAGHFIG